VRGPHKDFQKALALAPSKPGCYLLEDKDGEVLYVGRAVNLKQRTRAYLRPGADGRARLADLLEYARGASFRICGNEVEAILLEDLLIKEFQPPLNVQLKDDKSFLHIHLSLEHRFPRIGVARGKTKQGKTWGPFGHSGEARRTKELIQKAFQLRDCSDATFANRSRPCLKHEIRLCSAPCVGRKSSKDYGRDVDSAIQVLAGKIGPLVEVSRNEMNRASGAEEYELALLARDRMTALKSLAQPQRVHLRRGEDFDVLGLDERGCFSLLEYRGGRWLNSRDGESQVFMDRGVMVSSLLSSLYSSSVEIPPEILLPALPDDASAIEAWLGGMAGGKVSLKVPQRGEKKSLLRLAQSNSRVLKRHSLRSPWRNTARALSGWIGCTPPSVVDAVDVSHFQGEGRVASRVRFIEGKPFPESWRRFIVRDGHGNDDARGMEEVVRRIFRRKSDGLPDLMVLDGGPPQLNAGLRAMKDSGVDVPVAALAKARQGGISSSKDERLWVPGATESLALERGHCGRLFLEEIRNEAHRFAITHHRARRASVRTVLSQVPGVGPVRRKLLLEWCGGDLSKIRDGSLDELVTLPGLSRTLAIDVQRHLQSRLP